MGDFRTCVTITIIGELMCIAPDQETNEAGQKLLIGWWSAVAIVLATVAAMTFVVKPVLAWLFDLIF